MKRVDIETRLNKSRNELLENLVVLSDEQLRRPLTPSEHNPDNFWNVLDHVGHLALIETNFVAIIRRHLEGRRNPVNLLTQPDGTPRSREQFMASVHAWTEEYHQAHHEDSLSQVVSLTALARGNTLAFLSELTDEQLEEKVEGAPWADGSVGGMLGANADHANMHWHWATEAGLLKSRE